MQNLNSVLVEGEVVDHPQKGADEGDPCKFVIVSRKTIEENLTEDFIDVIAVGGCARVCNQILAKGRVVRVVGYLSTVKTDDPSLFFSRRYTHIIAQHVEFRPQEFTSKDSSVGKPLVDPDEEPEGAGREQESGGMGVVDQMIRDRAKKEGR